jgi:hypothetical protein
LEYNAYHAIRTSDEYAWVYSEGLDWWGARPEALNPLLQSIKDAIQSAKFKAVNNMSLGFELNSV